MRIKSLKIENFKLFDRKFDEIQDISKADLILLNGPNGYGKTSIFDAIEFALTGEIKRINNYSAELGVSKNESYDKKILIADETKKAYIKLLIEEKNCEIELQCIYNPPKNKGNRASKENNPYKIFENFERKLFVDGQEITEPGEKNNILEEHHLNQIEEFFDKCCFLSQDEHLEFLKEAKKNKATALDFIFKIPVEQQNEVDRVNKIINSLKNSNRTKELGQISKFENKENELTDGIKLLKSKVENKSVDDESKTTYQCLFPEKTIEWDAENALLDGEKYDEAMVSIEMLIYYSEHQEICLNYIFNKPVKDLIKPFNGSNDINYENNTLEYVYRCYSLAKNEELLENEYNSQKQYRILKGNIEKRELNNINWEIVSCEKLLGEDIIRNIKEKLKQVEELKKSQGIVSAVITSITEARIALMKYVDDAMNQSIIDNKRCPLCGASYTKRQELEEKISEEADKLQSLCDDSSKDIKNIIDGIYAEYLDNMLITIENKLQNAIPESIHIKIQEVKKYKSKICQTKDLLQKININLPEKYQDNITEINREYNALIQNITMNLKEVPEEIEAQLIAKDFVHEYDKYYDKNQEKFKKVTSELLHLKNKYIKKLFFNSNMKLINEKNNELKKIRNRKIELNKIYDDLCKYRDAIQDGIKEYKRKIIWDIEPLLYVYTAKILQQKFNGKSIFILTDDDMKNIQLINSVADNQDILYNMSSGQLAAVSLSFLLCMNQVYAKQQSLPILLIDDPIQTIDDVNMVGLVDILRYEFEDRQIFISSHEQKFEWYLKYKYEKAEKNIESFNMKNIVLQAVKQ